MTNAKTDDQVAVIYKTSTNAESIAAEIGSANGVKAAAYQADVGEQQSIEQTVQRIAADFGKLDIIVANSGI